MRLLFVWGGQVRDGAMALSDLVDEVAVEVENEKRKEANTGNEYQM